MAANASFMISADTKKEADITIITNNGEMINKDKYGNKKEWKTPDQSGEAQLTVKAVNKDGGTSTRKQNVTVKMPPVKPINYNLYSDVIDSTNVDITFRNNSGKSIKAIDLEIIAWNNFNERVPTSSSGDDYTMGATASDISFPAGTEKTYTWEYLDIYFYNPITKVKAYVTRIAYEDDSTWTLKN